MNTATQQKTRTKGEAQRTHAVFVLRVFTLVVFCCAVVFMTKIFAWKQAWAAQGGQRTQFSFNKRFQNYTRTVSRTCFFSVFSCVFFFCDSIGSADSGGLNLPFTFRRFVSSVKLIARGYPLMLTSPVKKKGLEKFPVLPAPHKK